jgi:hypothetical protein
MYHHSESMVVMLEDMQRNTANMEAEVKMMLEMEGRAMGIELDRRKNARHLMEELQAHIASKEMNDASMTWAYIDEGTAPYDVAMPEDHVPASTMLTEDMSAMTDGSTEEDMHVEPENLP